MHFAPPHAASGSRRNAGQTGFFSSYARSIKPQMKKLPFGSCEKKAAALRENALRAGENLFLRNR